MYENNYVLRGPYSDTKYKIKRNKNNLANTSFFSMFNISFGQMYYMLFVNFK